MGKGAPSTHLWVAFVSTVFRNTGREIAKGLLNQIQPVVISNEPACPYSGLTAQHATLLRSKSMKRRQPAFKVSLNSLGVHGPNPHLESVFRNRAGATNTIIVVLNPLPRAYKKNTTEILTTRRIPSMAESSQFLFDAGLVSYGTDWVYMYKRAAAQVAKILKGNQPADIPIEQAMKFELFINLKTAKQIGPGV